MDEWNSAALLNGDMAARGGLATDGPMGSQAVGTDFFSITVRDEDAEARIKEGEEGYGIPQFKVVDMVTLRTGDKNNMPTMPVDAYIKGRFGKRYKEWKENAAMATSGVPLEMLPGVTSPEVMGVKFVSQGAIKSIEDMAHAPEEVLLRLPNYARPLQQKCRAYLERAKSAGGDSKLASENAELRLQMAALKEQMDRVLLATAKPSEPEKPKKSKKAEEA